MRRSRDEPPAESHAPTRDEVMKGFAVWRAGRSAASPSPVKPPRAPPPGLTKFIAAFAVFGLAGNSFGACAASDTHVCSNPRG